MMNRHMKHGAGFPIDSWHKRRDTVNSHPEVGPGGCETLDFGMGDPKIHGPQKHEVARYPQIPANVPISSEKTHRKDP